MAVMAAMLAGTRTIDAGTKCQKLIISRSSLVTRIPMEHCSRMQSGTTGAVEWMASRLESKIDFSSELLTQLTPIALNDEAQFAKINN